MWIQSSISAEAVPAWMEEDRPGQNGLTQPVAVNMSKCYGEERMTLGCPEAGGHCHHGPGGQRTVISSSGPESKATSSIQHGRTLSLLFSAPPPPFSVSMVSLPVTKVQHVINDSFPFTHIQLGPSSVDSSMLHNHHCYILNQFYDIVQGTLCVFFNFYNF